MPSEDIVSIYIVNEADGCSDLTIESQVSFTSCSQSYIVRISNQSNATGPFSIYTGSTSGTPIYSAVTRVDMVAGQSFTLSNSDQSGCVTPTPTPTSTITPTPSVTPTNTPTPSITSTNTPTPSITPTITPTTTATPTVTPTVTPTIPPTPSVTSTLTPTPSITPSVTVTTSVTITPTVTPSETPTNTPTNTVTPSTTETPTPTPTMTPTASGSVGTAYLFIEPQSGSTNIGQYMFDGGYNFYGFTNLSAPDTSSQVLFSNDMNGYVSFTGWTGGVFPTVRTQSVPQVSGGVDAFGNSIVAYNFTTHEVPVNTVSNQAWYTWIIPTGATNNLIQYQIDVNSFGNPNSMTTLIMDSTIYTETFNYTGSTIPTGVYRVYTTFADLSFYLDNGGNTIYFRGNSVI